VAKGRAEEIREFLIRGVAEERANLATDAAKKFGITRQAVSRYLKQMVQAGFLAASGQTRGRTYTLPMLAQKEFRLALAPGLREDAVWRDHLTAELTALPNNVVNICHYGFTEMFNNAVDHSEGTLVMVTFSRNAARVEISVIDDGVGIFRKVKEGLNLADEREAILELAKGKVTTDPEHHTGEGVFFSLHMFDEFSLFSGNVLFWHVENGDDWLTELRQGALRGTSIRMIIATRTTRTPKEVFDRYASGDQDYDFSRTRVPVKLLEVGEQNLISRSQAKRLLTRFDRFKEVILDFQGVPSIGQAFADEVFRVFRNHNPKVHLSWVNASGQVDGMIKRAMAASESPPDANSTIGP
jgi:hypothetical protein